MVISKNVIIASLVMGVTGLLIFKAFQQWFPNTPKPIGELSELVPQTVDSHDISNWPLFVTHDNSFALRYPPDWTAKKIESNKLVSNFGKPKEAWHLAKSSEATQSTNTVQVMVVEVENNSISQIIDNCDTMVNFCMKESINNHDFYKLDLRLLQGKGYMWISYKRPILYGIIADPNQVTDFQTIYKTLTII